MSTIADMTEKTTPVGTDELEIQETGGGTSKKVQIANIMANLPATTLTSGDLTLDAGDVIVTGQGYLGTGSNKLRLNSDDTNAVVTADATGSVIIRNENAGGDVVIHSGGSVEHLKIASSGDVTVNAGDLTVSAGVAAVYGGTANRILNLNSTDTTAQLAMQDGTGGVIIDASLGNIALLSGGASTIGSAGALVGLKVDTNQDVSIPNGDLAVSAGSVTATEGELKSIGASGTAKLLLERITSNTASWEFKPYDNTIIVRDIAAGVNSTTFESGGGLTLNAGDLSISAGFLGVGAQVEITASSGGAITPTQSNHDVDTYADAATDDVTSIVGGSVGQLLFLTSAHGSRDPTIKDAGTLYLNGDAALTDQTRQLTLRCIGSGSWTEVARNF